MKTKFQYLFLVTLALQFASCGGSKSSNKNNIPNVDKNASVQVYETTGTKAKIMSRSSDLSLIKYDEDSFNTKVSVSNKTDFDFDGFGCALTHSSAYLLYNTEPSVRIALLEEMFGKDNANFKNIRIPLGTSDYTEPTRGFYSYDDCDGYQDYTLSQFSIEKELEYYIPMIKEVLKINPDIKVYGTPWSAPGWMKTSNDLIGGRLKGYENDMDLTTFSPEEVCYANYLFKCLQEFKKQGVTIDYISIINEPFVDVVRYPSMAMEASQHFRVAKKLCTFIDNSKDTSGDVSDTRLFVYDHNVDDEFDLGFESFVEPLVEDKLVNKYVSTFALHCYSKMWTQIYDGFLYEAKLKYPGKKFIISEVTESQSSVDFAQNLGWSACNVTVGPTNSGISTALYWNACLTSEGEPVKGNNAKCFGVATLENNQYSFNPAYYSLLHTSKFAKEYDGKPSRHVITECTNPGIISVSSYYNANKDRVIVLANISDISSEKIDVVFANKLSVTIDVQPQSITTLIVTDNGGKQFETINYQHIEIIQKTYDLYVFKILTDGVYDNLELYISDKEDEYKESDKIGYTREYDKYVSEVHVTPGDFYLNARSGDKTSSILLTIPRMFPHLERIETETFTSTNVCFGFSSRTSWSSFVDPSGISVYKSQKESFDNTASLVKSGIKITEGNYNDRNVNDEDNYFIVLDGKNGLTTFYSSAVTYRDEIVEEESIKVYLKVVDGRPYLYLEANYLKDDYKIASLILKDDAYERFNSTNEGDNHFVARIDLSVITTLNKWYDIMLERGNGISLDIYKDNCVDFDQKIVASGAYYEFKEYDNYLKVNKYEVSPDED